MDDTASTPRPRRSARSRALESHRHASLQRQARALGDPTRHAILRWVADAPGPVDVATLTARFGLNHNAIRQHLAKLCEAGFLVESQASSIGPGRPRLQYRPAPDAPAAWGTTSPYERLSLLVLELLAGERSPRQVGADEGRRMTPKLPRGSDPVAALQAHGAQQGFEPRLVERPSSLELVLERCPFEAAATASPEIVCELHRGLAEGITEATGATVQVVDLVAHNPSRAGCRLKLRRVPPPSSTSSERTD